MRWFWFDRYLEFESGHRAVAIKNVSLGESHLIDYFPGFPVQPDSLIVEGLAQAGGLLVGESNNFNERVVLAKIAKAVFHFHALPGDTLTYTVKIESLQESGAIVKGTSHLGDQLQAEIDLVFAHLDDRFRGGDLFNPAEFLCMIRTFGIYDVGRKSNGDPLEVPLHLVEAERAAEAAAS